MGVAWAAVVDFVEANRSVITAIAVFLSGAVAFINYIFFQIRKARLEIRDLRRRQAENMTTGGTPCEQSRTLSWVELLG